MALLVHSDLPVCGAAQRTIWRTDLRKLASMMSVRYGVTLFCHRPGMEDMVSTRCFSVHRDGNCGRLLRQIEASEPCHLIPSVVRFVVINDDSSTRHGTILDHVKLIHPAVLVKDGLNQVVKMLHKQGPQV